MDILKAYGVQLEIVDAVNMMYTNPTVQVSSPGGDIEFFEIRAGGLQGDTLAPYRGFPTRLVYLDSISL